MGMLARAFDFSPGRRSIENPATDMASWVNEWSSGGTSDSGMPVSEKTSVRLSTVWRCVRVLADGVGVLPLFIMQRQEPRGRRRVTDHALSELLHLAPNPRHSSFDFRRTTQANVVLQGNGYAAIRRDRGGRIRELWPIPATIVEPKIRGDGSLYYEVRLSSSMPEIWESSEMLHVPGMGFDGIKGMSVLSAAREGIGHGLSLQKYGTTVFKRGGRIPGVIQTPLPTVNPDQRKNVRVSWDESVGGPDNWHTPAIFPKGWEWKEIGIKPEEGQWLESKNANVLDVCRYMGVNPHKVYDYSRATFTNIENTNLAHVLDDLMPWVVCWEQELNRKLLTEKERASGLFIEFALQGMMRGDTAARGLFYSLGRQWGWFSANDVRDRENDPDIGPSGDVYLTPFNMANSEELLLGDSGGGAGGGAAPNQQPAVTPTAASVRALAAATGIRGLRLRRRIKAAEKPIIEDRARLIVNREIGAVEKMLKAMLGADPRNRRDLGTLRKELDEFYREHASWAAQRMQPVMASYAELVHGAIADEIGQDPDSPMPAQLQKFVSDYTKRFGAREASEGRLQLLALAEEGDEEAVAEAMRTRLGEWGEKRPGKIAVNESTQFMAAAAKTLYVAAGVTVLRWVANPGACPFCASMDGRVAGVQQNFVNAGQGVDGGEGTEGPMVPSDNIGHPPLHGNCECLPGDARVLSASAITAQSERRFDGELFAFRTASGKQLSCTPNHPVLTDRGWVGAETLDIGDHVISSRAREWNATVVGDHENVPATIEQIARAFGERRLVATVPVPGTAEQFHGDGRAGEVTIVRTNCKLLREVEATFTQEDREGPLVIRAAPAVALLGYGPAAFLGEASNPSSCGAVGGGGLLLTLGLGGALPLQELRGRITADGYASRQQALADCPAIEADGARKLKFGFAGKIPFYKIIDVDFGAPPLIPCQSHHGAAVAEHDSPFSETLVNDPITDAERLGNGELALAGDVFFDKVIHVQRYPFHGMVYNLQTTRGFYVAGGIVTHNCDIVAG